MDATLGHLHGLLGVTVGTVFCPEVIFYDEAATSSFFLIPTSGALDLMMSAGVPFEAEAPAAPAWAEPAPGPAAAPDSEHGEPDGIAIANSGILRDIGGYVDSFPYLDASPAHSSCFMLWSPRAIGPVFSHHKFLQASTIVRIRYANAREFPFARPALFFDLEDGRSFAFAEHPIGQIEFSARPGRVQELGRDLSLVTELR